ncbi:hypothetical protein J6590_048392 [Homalodisca vitripennis]|nr:hypothetical protein J6590_048392 [Homalodisca vitripennis]
MWQQSKVDTADVVPVVIILAHTVLCGVPGLSNRFASSFLLLDKLGLAAREGVALVVRQSLYAGHYALIDRTTLRPNPDWWVSYVYKKLVAPTVLSIKAKGEVRETLRLYAHCSHNGSVVMFGVNLSNAPEQLMVETSSESAAATVQLFQLTAPDLLSQEVILNGIPLRLPSDSPPSLQSVTVDIFQPIKIAGHSIFFLHLGYLQPYTGKEWPPRRHHFFFRVKTITDRPQWCTEKYSPGGVRSTGELGVRKNTTYWGEVLETSP